MGLERYDVLVMELVKPSEKYLESYYRGCVETWGHVQDNYILHNPDEYESWKTTIFDDYDSYNFSVYSLLFIWI